jgi:hypothetical protein
MTQRMARLSGWLLVAGVSLLPMPFQAQQSTLTPQVQAGSTPPATTTAPVKHTKKHRPGAASTAAPAKSCSAGGIDETPAQRAQDQKLLQQQSQDSQATKQVNDQQVQAFDASQKKVQNEPRIQDAPGPAQTATPGTTKPADTQGIQEAPGPAQTSPPATPAPQL